jgi:hypothetical protein
MVPLLGTRAAELIEAPIMLAAVIFAARAFVRGHAEIDALDALVSRRFVCLGFHVACGVHGRALASRSIARTIFRIPIPYRARSMLPCWACLPCCRYWCSAVRVTHISADGCHQHGGREQSRRVSTAQWRRSSEVGLPGSRTTASETSESRTKRLNAPRAGAVRVPIRFSSMTGNIFVTMALDRALTCHRTPRRGTTLT